MRIFQRFILLAMFPVITFCTQASAHQVKPLDFNYGNDYGNTIEIDAFDDLQAGDLIVATLHFIRSVELIDLDGFTLIHAEETESVDETDISRAYVAALYKIATGDEESFMFVVEGNEDPGNTSVSNGVVIWHITGHDPDNPIGAVAGKNSGKDKVDEITVGPLSVTVRNSLLMDGFTSHYESDNTKTDMASKNDIYIYELWFGYSAENDPEYIQGQSRLVTVPQTGTPVNTTYVPWPHKPGEAAGVAFVINNAPIPPVPLSHRTIILAFALMVGFFLFRVTLRG